MTGLCVTALRLSYFRSHIQTQLTFETGAIAISGLNGAGKTNILEALSLLSPGRGLRRAALEALPNRDAALGWKISATLHGAASVPHEIETSSIPQASGRAVRVDGKAVPQTRLGELLRVLWLVPAMDRLWIEGAEARRRFLDRIALSFAPDHAEVSLTYEKALRERNKLLKEQIRDPHWYAVIERRMADAARQIEAHRVLALNALIGAQQANETAHFPTAELSITYPDAALPEDWPVIWASRRAADLSAGRTLHGPHRADLVARYAAKQQLAAECSTGEQKALLIRLIIANAQALAQQTGFAPVLLLDEVAAHLDPSRRHALYDEIERLGAQAFMTATEIGLFDSLGKRAQYIHVTEENGQSCVHI